MDFLRNLPTQQPQQLTQLIQIQPGRVVSMAMSRQEHCQMTLLAFGDGESISEECYFGDIMPAGIPHAVQAVTAFKMYLVVVKTPSC